jgi:tetratricopeptide (TPR) repeat protein
VTALLAALNLAPASLCFAADAASREPAATAEQVEQAIAQLDEARRRAGDDPQRAAIEKQLAELWVLRARQHRARAQVDSAVVAYEHALALVPSQPQALVELGWLHLEAGQPELARSRAETCLANNPDDPLARALLGEIHYRDNRLEDALADFTLAARARPDDSALAERVAKIRRELAAERDYRRTDSNHFILRFDGAREQALGALLLDALEDQLASLQREIDVPPVPPITVILYTKTQFRETTGAAENIVGLYDGKVRLPVGGVNHVSPALQRVLRHELTHALLHLRSRGTAPRWLHEGLAQLLEPRDPRRARVEVRRDAPADRPIDLEPFSYPKALSFVAWLDKRAGRGRLLWFVDLLAERTNDEEAFERAFGASRRDLIEEWGRWLRAAD